MANAPGQGRKPKPTALRLLQGNPGKRPIKANEPKPPPSLPEPPEHLDDRAKEEWWRIGSKLMRQRIVTELDSTALAVYCAAYSRWGEAEEKLRQFGTVVKSPGGFFVQSPYLAIANKSMEQMMRVLVEFGMTPSSRTRITVEPEQEEDPMDLLRKRAG